MNPKLLEMLACPVCKHSLNLKKKEKESKELLCPNCARRYLIKDNIALLVA